MGIFTDRSALLIVDMIYDFVHPLGALAVPGAEKIVPTIVALAREARRMGIPVIHVTDSHEAGDREFELWPEHAVAGSGGSRPVAGLEPRENDYHLEKKRYSAFFETDLKKILLETDVEHLVITGTVTNICVLTTSTDAVMMGFTVTIPRAGVAALNDEDQQFAFRQIEQVLGGKVI